jgi:hypothetical protein
MKGIGFEGILLGVDLAWSLPCVFIDIGIVPALKRKCILGLPTCMHMERQNKEKNFIDLKPIPNAYLLYSHSFASIFILPPSNSPYKSYKRTGPTATEHESAPPPSPQSSIQQRGRTSCPRHNKPPY